MDTKENRSEMTKTIIERDILLSCGLNIRKILSKMSSQQCETINEIRLRVNKPIMFTTSKSDFTVNENGEHVNDFSKAYIATIHDILQTVELMCENSLYAFQEEIKNGFITLKGGHRVGITGKTVIEKNEIKTIKDISGLNIRIARQVKGCAGGAISQIINNNDIFHTLIISPPNCGKTTMLRDVIRLLSQGIPSLNFNGVKVGLVDERSEIAACYKGIPQNDVGIRTDVLDGCSKPSGILMLLRSMSPKVIVTDELGTKEDIAAVEQAINAGVKIITTAHAGNIDELYKKTSIGELSKQGFFERIIILSGKGLPGTIENIYDGCNNNYIWRAKNVS